MALRGAALAAPAGGTDSPRSGRPVTPRRVGRVDGTRPRGPRPGRCTVQRARPRRFRHAPSLTEGDVFPAQGCTAVCRRDTPGGRCGPPHGGSERRRSREPGASRCAAQQAPFGDGAGVAGGGRCAVQRGDALVRHRVPPEGSRRGRCTRQQRRPQVRYRRPMRPGRGGRGPPDRPRRGAARGRWPGDPDHGHATTDGARTHGGIGTSEGPTGGNPGARRRSHPARHGGVAPDGAGGTAAVRPGPGRDGPLRPRTWTRRTP